MYFCSKFVQNISVFKIIEQQVNIENVSLGSVHSTLSDLTNRGYVVENGKSRLLRKRQSLIDRWTQGYNDTLKPKLFISRFTFLSPVVRTQWQSIQLPKTLSWGGEPAAALMDGYLRPERWDIYTADNANALIATGRMIPDPQGEIYVYKRFWQTDDTPLLVMYADLMATEDDRCREAAERLKHTL